jgi:DnaJ-class molecular chaperone
MKSKLTSDFNPYAVLEIDPEANDERVRAAYLAKLKEYPPDRAPAQFEQVRDAYELVRDRRRRTQFTLFGINPNAPLESLLEGMNNRRPFIGPDQWLAVLKER